MVMETAIFVTALATLIFGKIEISYGLIQDKHTSVKAGEFLLVMAAIELFLYWVII